MGASLILERLASCDDDPRRLKVVAAELEDTYGPTDFADAIAASRQRPEGDLLDRLIIARQLKQAPAEAYQVTEIADGLTLYSDPAPPPSWKTLLIAWTGRGGRVGLPTVSFVQMFPSNAFDVLVVRDRCKAFFERGIEGYAPTLRLAVERFAAELRIRGYKRIVTLGVSTGGLAAVRSAILLGAERAVSMGGLFVWHIGYKDADSGSMLPAFDLLCACRPRRTTRIIAVYGENHERDRRDAERLALIAPPVDKVVVHHTDIHNLLNHLRKEKELDRFLRTVIGF